MAKDQHAEDFIYAHRLATLSGWSRAFAYYYATGYAARDGNAFRNAAKSCMAYDYQQSETYGVTPAPLPDYPSSTTRLPREPLMPTPTNMPHPPGTMPNPNNNPHQTGTNTDPDNISTDPEYTERTAYARFVRAEAANTVHQHVYAQIYAATYQHDSAATFFAARDARRIAEKARTAYLHYLIDRDSTAP